MNYRPLVAEVFRQPWAILPEKLQSIADLIALKVSGELTDAEIQAKFSAGPRPSAKSSGSIAVIPIHGAITPHASLFTIIFGGTPLDTLAADFRQAVADPNVSAIVLDIDSPGGAVAGLPEMAAEILDARKDKKIVAHATTAASAAYWLGSAAGELSVSPSGMVGSIGVIAAHEDMSKALENEGIKISLITAGKYKADGNPFEPLSESARAELQSKVDGFYGMFVKSVAKGRGVSQEAVRSGFGEGRMVMASDAVKIGMADRIETMDQALQRLGARAPQRSLRAQLARELELVAATL